jgi:PAS domain S-box-containing protein
MEPVNEFKSRRNLQNLSYIFVVFICLISIASAAYFENQKRLVRSEKQNDLAIIAGLKASQIGYWRQERMADARTMLMSFQSNGRLQGLINNAESSEGKRLFTAWAGSINDNGEYKSIYLFDRRLKELASVNAGNEPVDGAALEEAGQALKENRILFSELQRNAVSGTIHLDIAIPIGASPGGQMPAGVVFLRLDPQKFLYPFLQPSARSDTMETILVRREGDKVIFLNDVRFRENTALVLTASIIAPDLPAAMAARQIEGIVEGVDYRGVAVVAAIKKVPDSSWFLVAKMDKEEVYALIRSRAWMVVLVSLGFVLAAGASIGFLWSRQAAGFYRRQYDAELERKAVDRHYDHLRYANDIIFLFNDKLNIVEANDAATTSYGYTRDELLRLNLKDLRPGECLHTLPYEMQQMQKHGKLVYETVHRRKDGTTFPVEISTRLLVIEWKEFYQSIIRDIDERRKS